MSRPKKSKAVPIVLVLTILIAALAVLCFLINPLVIQPKRDAIAKANEAAKAEVEQHNQEIMNQYQLRLSELEREANTPTYPDWPEPKQEGWDLVDLSNIPLENQISVPGTRAELMTKGMLLVNPWHARPADFNEQGVISVAKAYKGDDKIQAKDNNVTLFENAIAALHEALVAAKKEGYTHYLVEEGFRTYAKQEEYYKNKMSKLASKYEGTALEEATKKEVNEPGHSEYNSGLAFELRLYDRNDADVAVPKYSTTPEAKWMNEHCWEYGIVFRFPQNGWPLESYTDKSFKTGVSMKLNVYRYVGKGNAAIMHYMDFTMEEYIEYLAEHPHIALFKDGKLMYEVYRQYVGDANEFNIQLTGKISDYESSLDNMGAIITVFNNRIVTDNQ